MIVSSSPYDGIIVGAGPAGSSLAIRLAQSGRKVLLVEQKKFPRAKLCGEFISPECLTHFNELGVLDEMNGAGGGRLERTVFYARNGRSLSIPSDWFTDNSTALGLSRAEMDRLLLTRASTAGAEVLEETQVTKLLRDDKKVSGVQLRDRSGKISEITAALTLDATGRTRMLARQVDEYQKRERAEFVAFKTHLKGARIPDGDCEIYAYRGGYGGLNRVENGMHNLCFIVSARVAKKYGGKAVGMMKNVVCENKQAQRSLAGAEIVEDWLAVPIESYGRAALTPADGLLAVGDAAAFIDPFTGSGILLALESAKIAANVIDNGLSSEHSFAEISGEYDRQYSRAFDRRLRISSLVRHAAFVPFLAESVIKALSLSERLTRRLAKATRQIEQSV